MSNQISTKIWHEEHIETNPFIANKAFCHGFDVYGDMLGRASWLQMVWLLFQGNPPNKSQLSLFEDLAFSIANPGPRDPSVHAAMCAGTGGSTSVATLMAALSVGAGQKGGAKEVFDAYIALKSANKDVSAFVAVASTVDDNATIWPQKQTPPGFDPQAEDSPLVLQVLAHLAKNSNANQLIWLQSHKNELEQALEAKINMQLVAACAFMDLGFNEDQAEMLYLLLRLPGAAAHALEQKQLGPKHFPFFELDLQNDPQEQKQ